MLFVITETILLFIIAFFAGQLASAYLFKKDAKIKEITFKRFLYSSVFLLILGLVEYLSGSGDIIDTGPIITKIDGETALNFQTIMWSLYGGTVIAGLVSPIRVKGDYF